MIIKFWYDTRSETPLVQSTNLQACFSHQRHGAADHTMQKPFRALDWQTVSHKSAKRRLIPWFLFSWAKFLWLGYRCNFSSSAGWGPSLWLIEDNIRGADEECFRWDYACSFSRPRHGLWERESLRQCAVFISGRKEVLFQNILLPGWCGNWWLNNCGDLW